MRVMSKAPNAGGLGNPNVTTAQFFTRADDVTKACRLALPGSLRFEQKKFLLRASGAVSTNVATNVTISLYKGTSLVAGNNTLVKASTARAQDGSGGLATAPWFLEAELVFDSVSGKLHGSSKFCVNNNLDAAAAITAVTGIDGNAEPPIEFVVAVTFSVADPLNSAHLGEFVVGF